MKRIAHFAVALTLLSSLGMAIADPATVEHEDKFQAVYGKFWHTPVSANARYEPIRLNPGNPKQSGFHAARFRVDPTYRVVAHKTDPIVPLYIPASWNKRAVGKRWQGKLRLPVDFVVPDTKRGDTPNNAATIINVDTWEVHRLNAVARPEAGGPIWGYNGHAAHAGSGLSGGEITDTDLAQDKIPHALSLLVEGKYLSKTKGGFTGPARRADSNFGNPKSPKYYAGKIDALRMGAHLAIPPGVTAKSLGIQSPVGLKLLEALKTYGGYITDTAGWDAVYLSATPDIARKLMTQEKEILRLFGALQIVKP